MEKNETGLKNKVIYFGCFHRNAKRQSANNVTLRFSRDIGLYREIGLYLTLPPIYDNIGFIGDGSERFAGLHVGGEDSFNKSR